jgi:squalene-hopene/tetraprenyl-beta-curcumene cyclase
MRLEYPAGYWMGELEADTSLESDYILAEYFLRHPRPDKIRKAANYILERQLPEGGWSPYPGGPPAVSLVVKAYLALKLAGYPASAPELQRARKVALELGGVQAANSYTKVSLACFRQYDWSACPAIPPEILFLPQFSYFSIYDMSSWTRAILVPLSIIWAHKPRRLIPHSAHIDEIFLNGRRNLHMRRDRQNLSWRNLFLALDQALKQIEKSPVKPLRSQALRAAEKWMVERFEKSGGLGAIYPSILDSAFALDCLGYPHDHPLMQQALKDFYAFEIEEGDTLRMQPCISPVWDTAIAHFALTNAGIPAELPALVKAADWLLDHQALGRGDWQVKNKKAEPGGWYFEFANEFYPDVDDTAMVLLALSRARASDPHRLDRAVRRGLAWMLSMQCSDGGFAAFDVDNTHAVLCHVPFADHNAMLDPSCPDITGRALEAMARFGYRKGSEPADRAIAYLKRAQEQEGCWFGRWGVNYIYGTCFALRGLHAVGEDMCEGYVVRAIEWLRSVQNPDGGWGESCDSYDDPDLKGTGESTASQTAWALMALFAFGDFHSTSVQRGIQYLVSTQAPEGTWNETQYTGTGFPGVFYLKYHLYRQYFPLLCLTEYAQNTGLIPASGASNNG